ncbi:MAG TPA: hypothetical protein DCX27_08415 [Balneola sp.]|nr:hypothetical protein [Balneola sp.]
MSAKLKVEVGDVDYSELSETLKFTVVLNKTAIDCIIETLFTSRDMVTNEEVALAAADALNRGIAMDVTRGGMRSPVINPFEEDD